jgi:hypothetical protein
MSRRELLGRLGPALLIVAIGAAILVPFDDRLRLASADRDPAERWGAAIDRLPEDPDVLVGFDPDVGTYAEIRPTVRTVLAELLSRQARIAIVSLTPEGRMLALAEVERLDRLDANVARIADLGFLPGAEAALVRLTRSLPEPRTDRPIARRLTSEGLGTMDAIVVVGGNDLGPRSWIEQVRPRIGEIPILAVAPSVLLPELQPYLEGGQLTALLATPRDGAAYRPAVDLGVHERLAPPDEPSRVAVLVGLLVAAGVLASGLLRPLTSARVGARGGS